MYIVAEEDNKESDGAIIVISSNWLTPKKEEAFWPTEKNQSSFNKLLKNHNYPNEDWTVIKIKRKFFECGTCEMNVSDGRHCTTPPPSPARPPTEKSETCAFNARPIEILANSNNLDSGLTKSIRIGSFNSSFRPTTSSPVSAHHTSTTLSAAKTAYEYNVMQMLTTIKEQNTVILEWIRKQNAKEFQFKKPDLQLPVEFPLNDQEQLQLLEQFLANNQNFTDLCEYFGEFAGPTVTATVNGILRHTLTNKFAATYSFRGKKGKRAFEDLTLKTAIIRAVKKICNVVRDQTIEDDMKVWLKHAPQRIILQDKKIRARLERTA